MEEIDPVLTPNTLRRINSNPKVKRNKTYFFMKVRRTDVPYAKVYSDPHDFLGFEWQVCAIKQGNFFSCFLCCNRDKDTHPDDQDKPRRRKLTKTRSTSFSCRVCYCIRIIPIFLGDPDDQECGNTCSGTPRSFVVTFEPECQFSSEAGKQFHGREMIPIRKFLQSFNIETVQDIISMKIEVHMEVLSHSSSPPSLLESLSSDYGKKAKAFLRDVHDSLPCMTSKKTDEKKKKKTEVIQRLRIESLNNFSGRVCSPVFDVDSPLSSSDNHHKYFLEVERKSQDDEVTCSVMRVISSSSESSSQTSCNDAANDPSVSSTCQ